MKKLVLIICAVAIVAIAIFNVSLGLRGDNLSDLALANIEALAIGEDPFGGNGCPTIGISEILTYPSGKIASMCFTSDCGAGNATCEAFCWWQSYDEAGNAINSYTSEWSYQC